MSLSNLNLSADTESRVPRHSKDVTFSAMSKPPRIEAPLIAQIPDLNEIDADHEQDHAGGRVISQGLSRKLVLGCGLILVLAAILPFVLKRNDQPRPVVGDLPEWSSKAATSAAGVAPAFVPKGPASGSGTIYEARRTSPAATPAVLTPQPQVGTGRPNALGDPGWPPRDTPDKNPGPADSSLGHPADYRVSNPADYRASQGADPRRNDQADLRSNPARDNRGDRSDAFRGDSPRDYPGGGAVGNPLMPSPAPRVTASVQDPPIVEPGVARLEGRITTPPVRTDYDRAGPSDH
jgi:hypothetical protein